MTYISCSARLLNIRPWLHYVSCIIALSFPSARGFQVIELFGCVQIQSRRCRRKGWSVGGPSGVKVVLVVAPSRGTDTSLA
ncbi:hypothetical protein C8R44DRAFT_797969, partial [Mycena epipterygia]